MRTTSSTTPTTRKNLPKQKDAIALLIDDHELVKSLFEQYEGLGDRALVTKKKLATQICTELTIHATVEEEIFYPAARAAGGKDQDELVDEATVEHASAKDLIAQIMEMDAGEDLFDAKVKVLSELIEHHVKEEEEEMFPKARKDGLDLAALGQQMAERKAELT
jgi:iron-sulfur cluster repair protein YtfE (RIC family)